MDSCFFYASSPSNRLKSMAICSKVFQVLESGTEDTTLTMINSSWANAERRRLLKPG